MAEKNLTKVDVTEPTRTEQQLPETRDTSRFLVPAVDIYETEDGLHVIADVPGVREEDLDIRVEDRVLTISGKPSLETADDLLLQEYEMMPYFRQFRLGDDVDQDRIEARLRHGVLTLHLPKAEAARPRKIKVQGL